MKNRHCPYFRHCWDDCTDCEHSIRYNKLHEKIKRQKAEIERQQKYNTNVAFKHYNDAIKEFAERLKDKVDDPRTFGGYSVDILMDRIDSLVKEMTEGGE